jgi:TetR/AcrR family transcriptional repressor of bet genes
MPKQVDADAQRRTIAEAAITVIGEVGLDGARLRDIARAAGVTTGAVTHYFDDKDAVLEAALGEAIRRVLARQNAASGADRAGTVASFIRASGDYLPLDETGLHEWRVRLAFWGRAITDERLRRLHCTFHGQFAERLVELLISLRPTPPTRLQARRTADAVMAAIDGVGVRATLEPELWPPRRQRDTLAGLLLPLLTAFTEELDGA